MSPKIALSALSAVAFSAFATAAVPADPTITAPAVLPKRQNDARFIGYVSFSGSWYSEQCNAGLTWYQDSKYAQCCPATAKSCYAPTACVSGSLIYPYSDQSRTTTIACTENYDNTAYSICNTAFIFENMQDSNPRTDIVCGESSVNWSYYRKLDATVTAATSSIPTSIPQPVSTALVAPNVTTNNNDGGSKAWIAGAVVGPIVGLALIGALVWFFLRRKKNKKLAPAQGSAAMASANPSQPPPGVGGYTDAKPQFVPQQQPAFNQDPYANQGAFAAQQHQSYSDAPVSPAPQYNTGGAPYNNNGPVSPPPGQEYYGNDVKHAYTAPSDGAAELGGSSGAAPVAQASPTHQAAELGGDSRQPTTSAPYTGTSELPSNPKA
ncbi:hypothetical protein FB567DRAFT_240063 [Paraphoma chrysanthemicola]|uniref:Uncharacterized protein n=1 Tax=Paraphoma chrysanthemicola TaxID=798071 RepID=A0A8K0REB1_9PLEO|nr:hypothetical protein FB567DRAFT_240063 [Paraphoma chrysanthemicola]